MNNLIMSVLLSIFMVFCNLFGFAFQTQNTIAYQTQSEYYVTASSCYLYSEASFLASKVTFEGKDVILKHGDKLEFQEEVENFAFVNLKNIEASGYIYKYYITNNTTLDVYPVFNASIRENCDVFDLDKNPTSIKANKNQRVFLYEGFNDKEEYTAVQLVLEDGSLYNGYILSKNINPDGVSTLLIVAISIICASVTIILTLVFIKKKKKIKKKVEK